MKSKNRLKEKALSLLLTLCMAVPGSFAFGAKEVKAGNAEYKIPIGEIIPDYGLQAAVVGYDKADKMTPEQLKKYPVSIKDLEAVKEIRMESLEPGNIASNPQKLEKFLVHDCTGIEHLRNLERFQIAMGDRGNGDSVEELKKHNIRNVDFSNNKNLKTIILYNMPIVGECRLGNLPKLTTLFLDHDRLSKIDISGLKALNSTHMVNNFLREIDVSKNDNLKFINAHSNKIRYLNLKKNSQGLCDQYEQLTLAHNELPVIPSISESKAKDKEKWFNFEDNKSVISADNDEQWRLESLPGFEKKYFDDIIESAYGLLRYPEYYENFIFNCEDLISVAESVYWEIEISYNTFPYDKLKGRKEHALFDVYRWDERETALEALIKQYIEDKQKQLDCIDGMTDSQKQSLKNRLKSRLEAWTANILKDSSVTKGEQLMRLLYDQFNKADDTYMKEVDYAVNGNSAAEFKKKNKEIIKEMIKKAAVDKIAEIEKVNTTAEEKAAGKAKVEQEKTKGIAAVDKASTDENAFSERDKAIEAITAIKVTTNEELEQAKFNAFKEIREAADSKIKQIQGVKGALPEDVTNAEDRVKKLRDDGLAKVQDAAKTLVQINYLKNAVIQAINKEELPKQKIFTITLAGENIKPINGQVPKSLTTEANGSGLLKPFPEVEEKEDSYFVGWYIEEDGVGRIVDEDKVFQSDTTIRTEFVSKSGSNDPAEQALADLAAARDDKNKKIDAVELPYPEEYKGCKKHVQGAYIGGANEVMKLRAQFESDSKRLGSSPLTPYQKQVEFAKMLEEYKTKLDTVVKLSIDSINSTPLPRSAKDDARNEIREAANKKIEQIKSVKGTLSEDVTKAEEEVKKQRDDGLAKVQDAKILEQLDEEVKAAIQAIQNVGLPKQKIFTITLKGENIKPINGQVPRSLTTEANGSGLLKPFPEVEEQEADYFIGWITEGASGQHIVNEETVFTKDETIIAVTLPKDYSRFDFFGKALGDLSRIRDEVNEKINAVDLPYPDEYKKAKEKVKKEYEDGINGAIKINDEFEEEKKFIKEQGDLVGWTKEEIDARIEEKAREFAQKMFDHVYFYGSIMESVKLPKSARAEATQAIEAAATKKSHEIANAPNTTEGARKAAKDKVIEEKNKALAEINKADTVAKAEEARDKGITAINKVEVETMDTLNAAKDDAKKAIEDAAKRRNTEIDAVKNADPDEADIAKEKVEAERKAGLKKVTEADTSSLVNTAKEEAVAKIGEVALPRELATEEQLARAKSDAKEKIILAAANKKEKIENTPNTNAEGRAEAAEKVEAEKQKGLEAVEKADKVYKVETYRDEAIDAINDIKVETQKDLDLAKAEAKNAVYKAAEKRNKAIDEVKNADAGEVKKAKDKVEEEKNKGILAIDAAKTISKVNVAKDEAEKAIGDVGLPLEGLSPEEKLSYAKKDAKEKIEEAATKKNGEINKTADTTAEAREIAKEKVDKARREAREAVDNADSLEKVTQERDKGISEIKNVKVENIQTLDLGKEAAKEAIRAAAQKRNGEIDAVKNTNPEDVERAKEKVKNAKFEGIEAVENAKTVKAVNEAKDAAVTAIGNVELPKAGLTPEEELANAKKDAKAKIEDAATKKNDEIDKTQDTTAGAKAEAKAKVEAEKTQGIEEVEKSDKIYKVETARDNAIEKINAVKVENKQTLDLGKTEAKKAIEEAAAKRTGEIEAVQNADPEELKNAKAKVEEEKTKGLQAVEDSDTVTKVNDARDKAVAAIGKVALPKTVEEVLANAKKDAKAKIEAAAKKKTEEIGKAQNSTPEAIAEAKEKVEKAKAAAIEAVEKAENVVKVGEEKEKGIAAIEKIEVETIAELNLGKDDARKAIEQAAADKNKAIDEVKDADPDKVQLAKVKVELEKTKGLQAVTNAKTKTEVNKAKDDAVKAIGDIPLPKTQNQQLEDAKKNAKAKLEGAATKKNDEIDKTQDTTAEAREEAKAKVEQAKKAAISEIESADEIAKVEEARDKGIAEIEKVEVETKQTLDLGKTEAKKAINEAATKRNGEIDAVKNADADEVKNAKAKVEKEKTDGINAVENAKTVKAVNEAKDAAIEAIGKVELPKAGLTPEEELANAKKDAKAKIEDAATKKNDEIDKTQDTTAGAKAEAKAKVEAEKTQGIEEVEKSDKIYKVETARDNAIEKINAVKVENKQTLDLGKTEAKKAIEEAAAKRNGEIEAVQNADPEELKNAKAKVEEEKTKGLQAVEDSDTVTKVNDAREKAVEAIGKVALPKTVEEVLANAKKDAKAKIEAAAKKKTEEIGKAQNSTPEAIAEAKEKVEKAKAAAIEAVEKAENVVKVGEEKEKGIAAIEKIEVETIAELNLGKDEARKAIEQAAADKNKAIDEVKDADPDKVQLAKVKVELEKTKGLQAVTNAKTKTEVNKAKDDAVKAIGDIPLPKTQNQQLEDAKKNAKAKLEGAATKKNDEIDKTQDTTAEAREEAKAKVEQAKKAAISEIESADEIAKVEEARDKGIAEIEKVEVETKQTLDLGKTEAKKAINEAATKRNGEIDAVKNADADEVKNAKAKVEKEKTDGINAVENAKTVKAVNEAKDAAIEAIGKVELPKAGGVTPPAPTGEYTITFNPNGGKAATETAKTDKDGKLKDMPSATYEGYIFEGWYTEKDAGDKVDTNTVFKADTVIYAHWKEDKAYQDELKDLKAASVKEVEKAAVEKTAELEKTPNVKAEEIDKAKAKVEAEKAAGIKKINEGKTKSEVTESKDKAIEAIKAVKVDQGTSTPLDDAKDKAKEEIGKKADEAKDKITNDPNLSDEEKDKAKEEIDKEKEKADKKIDEATDESGVDKAKEAGEKAIADKAKEAEDKGNTNLANEKNDAKAKIEEAATKKNEEIDKASATPEAKQEAKDKVAKAKEAADKAVDNADTIAKVDEARDNGITEIGKVEVKTTTPTGKEYEVKFISNKIGATKEEVVETRKIKEGEKVGDLPKALTDENRPDYRFSGWYTKKEDGDKLEAETKIEKEMTIYAHWKKRPIAKNYADVSGNKFSIKGTKNLNVNEGVYQDEKLPKNTRPYQLTVTAKPSRRMLVEWTNCKKLGADIDGYIITRKVGRSDTFVHYATVGANRNYFIDTLPKKNTNYYYMVFGYKKDKMGNITISENSMSAVGQRLDSAKINPYAPKLNYTKKTIRQGESVKLRLTYPKNSISTWTRWRTHNDAVKVAKVNQQGVVTGLNKGTVLISARTPNGRDIRCLITVI